MTSLVKRVDMKTFYKELKAEKEEKLRARHSDEKTIENILGVEEGWEQYNESSTFTIFEEFVIAVRPFIRDYAKKLGYSWNDKRVSSHEFESAFMEEFWKLTVKYDPTKNDYYFSELLAIQTNRRKWDVTRHFTMTKQNKFENGMQSLENLESSGTKDKGIRHPIDMDKEVIATVLANEILNDDSLLSEQERRLLRLKYERPGISYLELARKLGLSHHEQARRIYTRAINKIKKEYIF